MYIISNLNESEAPRRLRELGISGYSVKANLTDDMIDQIVNKILRPEMAGPRTGYQDQQVAGPSAVEI